MTRLPWFVVVGFPMIRNHNDPDRSPIENSDTEDRRTSAAPPGVIMPDQEADPLIESIRRGSSYTKLSLGILGGALFGTLSGLGFWFGMIIGGFIGFVAEQVNSKSDSDDEKNGS